MHGLVSLEPQFYIQLFLKLFFYTQVLNREWYPISILKQKVFFSILQVTKFKKYKSWNPKAR